jgi:hypothetical protein
MLADSNKFAAFRDRNETFAAAADAYGRAADTGNALDYVRRAQFYALARVEGKESEALALGRTLFRTHKNRTPTLLVLLLVLEAHENPGLDVSKRAVELLGTPEKAYDMLSTHWRRTEEQFPVFGVAGALQSLEKILSIPEDKSIFKK